LQYQRRGGSLPEKMLSAAYRACDQVFMSQGGESLYEFDQYVRALRLAMVTSDFSKLLEIEKPFRNPEFYGVTRIPVILSNATNDIVRDWVPTDALTVLDGLYSCYSEQLLSISRFKKSLYPFLPKPPSIYRLKQSLGSDLSLSGFSSWIYEALGKVIVFSRSGRIPENVVHMYAGLESVVSHMEFIFNRKPEIRDLFVAHIGYPARIGIGRTITVSRQVGQQLLED
jgi:hypothetical protein